ncbi:MAG: cupin [Cyanothece sp. SIO1E1]|nr:cupin [Cyanothece sp. SIO1E1]
MQTLASILHPYSIDQFLSENWAQRGVFIPGQAPDRFQHFFSWQQLNDLLNFHKPRDPELRFVLKGQFLPVSDPQEWVKHCQRGASIVFSRVNERVPVLADLIWSLQQELGHNKAHVNIYCSWPAQQGFDCHYDNHEVFILQVDGQKEWFVFEDTLKYPHREEVSKHQQPPTGNPYIQCVLNPGDVLYIPRGHWHYAMAQTQPSLHLTLGIRCFSGKDWLEWLVEAIQGQEAFRKNLPLMPDGDTHALEEVVKDLCDRLTTTLLQEKEKLAQSYADVHTVTNTHLPRMQEISLPAQVGFGIFEQGLDTRLRQPKFQKVKVEPLADSGYRLITANKKINFKGLDSHIVENLVENLFNFESFTLGDVAEWLPESNLETIILPLLSGLIQEGMILVDEKRTIAQEVS